MFSIIDIGNTNTKVGAVDDDCIIESVTLPSSSDSLEKLVEFHVRHSIRSGVMCSVNPPFCSKLKEAFKQGPVHLIQVDHTNIPLSIEYRPPSDVGSDRLVIAYEAMSRTDSDIVIVDMGTAITFEAVKKGGIYLGGWIVPGINLMRNSLNDYTALLPLVDITSAGPMPGDTTAGAVSGGIYWAVRTMIPEMVKTLKQVLDEPEVYVTGGDAVMFADHFPEEWSLIPDIVMAGLVRLYNGTVRG